MHKQADRNWDLINMHALAGRKELGPYQNASTSRQTGIGALCTCKHFECVEGEMRILGKKVKLLYYNTRRGTKMREEILRLGGHADKQIKKIRCRHRFRLSSRQRLCLAEAQASRPAE